MEWLYVVLTIAILSHCNCKDVHMICPDENVKTFDVTCVGGSNCRSKPRNFMWINLNQGTGKVTVQFNACETLCKGWNKFVLEELVNITKDECNGTGFGHSIVTKHDCKVHGSHHSLRRGSVKEEDQGNENFPQREEMVNITFNMIYRGCYRLKIKKEFPLKVQTLCSPRVFLDTKFSKENFSKKNDLTISSLYDPKQDHMEHTVSGVSDMHVSEMRLTVGLCQPGEKCNKCATHGIYDILVIGLNLAGEFECKGGKSTSDCSLIGGHEVKCITENVDNQSQCLWVELDSHPCRGEGVWSNTDIYNYNRWCQWNSPPAHVRAVSEKPASAEGDQSIAIVLASVFSSLVVLCFLILLFIMRKKIQECLHYAPTRSQHNSPVLALPQVLLLYSRDCEPFMNLMVTFRDMLQEVIKCKVYDCFDPALAEEIATGAVEWLHRHFECDDMKIVVVESECAVFRQKEFIQGLKAFYENLMWLDDIFLYGLKELANDKRRRQYDRIFVVRVHGFTDGNDRLDFITPYTRFVIPQHMEELITSLYRQLDLEYTEQLHALERDVKTLEEYKRNNTDYMNYLLRRA